MEAVNTALKVLLKQREDDKKELAENVLSNVKELISPYLERLKKSQLNTNQKTLINILDSNLSNMISPFISKLSSKYLNLTPGEVRVANLVKEGKTRELLQLVPDTEVQAIERCSGHDGTYAVKAEFHKQSMKICRPVISAVEKANADHYGSDCPMAGHQIENGLKEDKAPEHPISLLRQAYGI